MTVAGYQLTPDDWRYISVLLAQDINQDMGNGRYNLAMRHQRIWQKIQGECHWLADGDDDDE